MFIHCSYANFAVKSFSSEENFQGENSSLHHSYIIHSSNTRLRLHLPTCVLKKRHEAVIPTQTAEKSIGHGRTSSLSLPRGSPCPLIGYFLLAALTPLTHS